MPANDDVDLMSPHGVIGDDNIDWYTAVHYRLDRARCCRDWPVLAFTRMGRCGYCGQVPVVIGSW